MVIDFSRYNTFLRNAEYFRLKYCKNLTVSRDKIGYGLQRGTAFHLIAEERYKGTTDAVLDTVLSEAVSDPKAISKATVMHKAFAAKYVASDAVSKLAAEVEFRSAIPGTQHEIAGRIDEILNYRGSLWCGETKTANARADYAKLKYDWQRNPQANFEIAGARSLGYQVEGVLVRTITEHSPPRIWEIEATRTDEEQQMFFVNVAQVCDTIEMYKSKYGVDVPWPHNTNSYPCNMEGRCEFEDICGKLRADVSGFAERKEHLPIILRPAEKP